MRSNSEFEFHAPDIDNHRRDAMNDDQTMPPASLQVRLSVILVAAGQSTRMVGTDKLMLEINGRPVLWYSLRVFNESERVDRVVVVSHETRLDEIRESIAESGFSKPYRVVSGGARRQDSVKNGIDEFLRWDGSAPFIAVHDAARPFLNAEMLRNGLSAAEHIGAAIPVVALKDTIKRVEHGIIVDTPDRGSMFAVQTPQIFRADVLSAAHETVTDDVTDDASMVEVAGGLVATFEGSYDNIKITTPSDIPIANAISGGPSEWQPQPGTVRYGIGFDGHALVDVGPLRLGGEDVDFHMRLKGHSDGDVLLHAVASAILGAAGLGDLGGMFPSSNPRYANTDSALFVREAATRAESQGWSIDHVDATVIAQRPRLAPHVPAFRSNLAEAIQNDIGSVNVKITSTDEVGAIGRGEGIAAQAIVTICRR